jgi:hypothetical protein
MQQRLQREVQRHQKLSQSPGDEQMQQMLQRVVHEHQSWSQSSAGDKKDAAGAARTNRQRLQLEQEHNRKLQRRSAGAR